MVALVPFAPGGVPGWRPLPFEARLGSPFEPFDVTITGELDYATGPRTQAVLFSAVDAAARNRIVVDLSSVSFIDSRGINALMIADEYARDCGRNMVFSSPGTRVMRVLELAQVTDILAIVRS